jgi:hypothetical protein
LFHGDRPRTGRSVPGAAWAAEGTAAGIPARDRRPHRPPGGGGGHNQKTRGHQIRQEERIKIKGKAEFFLIIDLEHQIDKLVNIVAGPEKKVS